MSTRPPLQIYGRLSHPKLHLRRHRGPPGMTINALIVKPCEACNFKCTFCSSTDIVAGSDRDVHLDLDYIFRMFERYPSIKTLIVNGGDPLMMKPDYYWRIIQWLEERKREVRISLTTNLWAFYKKPSMWVELFNHPLVGINTSFNYGGTRMITSDREFTEDIFWKVSDKMLELVGYRPSFISVITEANVDTALDNVRLAKRMGVECKLNYAMASGIQGRPLSLAKAYQLYAELWDTDLWQWEFNAKQLGRVLWRQDTCCPLSRSCDQGIRSLNPDGGYYSCGAFGDDQEKPIDFEAEMAGEFFTPLQADPSMDAMHGGCYGCELFDICNGCRKTVKDMKRFDMVEEHCQTMTALKPKLLAISEAVRLDPELTAGVCGHVGFGDENTFKSPCN